MKEFDELIKITDRLLAPDGCPWDRAQTFETIRTTVLEEVHELIEAINLKNKEMILEELADLFFNALFFCKLAEKEGYFKTEDVLKYMSEKLVRRHPHVFGEVKATDAQDAHERWNEMKAQEKKERKSKLDGIPENMPALAKAQKLIKRIAKTPYQENSPSHQDKESSVGRELLRIVKAAQEEGVDAENALLKTLHHQEREFRAWEKKPH